MRKNLRQRSYFIFYCCSEAYRQPRLLKWRHLSMKLTTSISVYRYSGSS